MQSPLQVWQRWGPFSATFCTLFKVAGIALAQDSSRIPTLSSAFHWLPQAHMHMLPRSSLRPMSGRLHVSNARVDMFSSHKHSGKYVCMPALRFAISSISFFFFHSFLHSSACSEGCFRYLAAPYRTLAYLSREVALKPRHHGVSSMTRTSQA